jgi:hypothetical protein
MIPIFCLFKCDRQWRPLLLTTKSPTRVSQQAEDAIAILIKSGHTDSFIQVVYIYAYDFILC